MFLFQLRSDGGRFPVWEAVWLQEASCSKHLFMRCVSSRLEASVARVASSLVFEGQNGNSPAQH